MRILGLIPARGGSKGIPGKNLKNLAGKSLLQRTFECAAASGVLERIVLSTDDTAAAGAAGAMGLEVPFMRPAALAGDESPMIDVAIHALTELDRGGYRPDALMLLQPTSPLRLPEHVGKAASLLGENEAVCSVVPLPLDLCPHYVMKVTAEGYLDHFLPEGSRYTRRQDVPPAYRRDGTIFLTRTEVIIEQRSFYGSRCVPLFIDPGESLNIDTPEDWIEAERVFSARPVQ